MSTTHDREVAFEYHDHMHACLHVRFMSTTHDREVAFEYAKGSGGIIFKMYMGMVDKGADLSPISQYPHECEICFPPLTALEVRGTHVDGSTTVVEVDARVCQTVFEHDFEQMSDIKTFQKHDADETGELDLHEFKRLARQLVPDVTDVHLESVFAAAGEIHVHICLCVCTYVYECAAAGEGSARG